MRFIAWHGLNNPVSISADSITLAANAYASSNIVYAPAAIHDVSLRPTGVVDFYVQELDVDNAPVGTASNYTLELAVALG